MKFTDNTIMPFGKHQGKPMSHVPADYLLWLYKNDRCSSLVRAYIEANITRLDKHIAEAARQKENNAKLRFMYK